MMRRAIRTALIGITVLFGWISCTASLDMSGERLTPPGPQWGLVIGSVLVQPAPSSSGNAKGRDDSYEFEIVHIQPADPDGENPYADRYRLDAKAGEERIFISRLRSGRYLVKTFHQTGVVGLGGELEVTFDSMAGEVRYIGRLRVDIPQRLSRGKGYRFAVENARDTTLAQVSKQHGEVTKTVVDTPMLARVREAP
ncbi:MAG TPA: hypothetical protein VJ746_05395 [Nitrospira sp.]|nr:hypothetical protein [Nitrospira sp.]